MSSPQYVDPPEGSKTIEIGNYVTVMVGDLIGTCGLVLWVAGEFIWLQDNTDLHRSNDHTAVATPFLACASFNGQKNLSSYHNKVYQGMQLGHQTWRHR
jgi:hypothetical protein